MCVEAHKFPTQNWIFHLFASNETLNSTRAKKRVSSHEMKWEKETRKGWRVKVVWIKSKWQPACNTETDHFSHRCRLLRCHRQSHLFDFCGAYQIAEHFKTHYYISRVCASEEFESWSVSDFIDAAFTMLVPFMDVCVCAWNTFCIPNSVILITFDTYKLRLSECVRISVMAFHNCKIDSIRSLAHTPNAVHFLLYISPALSSTSLALLLLSHFVMSRSIFKILRFSDFICVCWIRRDV